MSVKPAVVPNVLAEVKAKAAGKLFISVAMGVTINQIEKVGNAHRPFRSTVLRALALWFR